MRILELGKYYPPFRGGMETLVKAWSEGFVAKGAAVECVVANDRPTTVHETINGVSVHRLARLGVALSTPVCPAYPWSTRRHAADVWHLHVPNPLGDLACLLGSGKVPLVVHYHSDIVRQAGAMKLYGAVVRRVLERATRIITATPQQIEYSPWLQPVRDKCRAIPFGIELARFGPNETLGVEAAGLRSPEGGRPIFLTIGRLVGYKGHRFLLEAMRELDARLWIVGTGPLEADLRAQVQAQGLGAKVSFLGDVEDARLPGLLHACDVFVLPSITPNEAFGLVQIEAMACGKPVVSCNLRSGVPFVNLDGVTGRIVPPMDSRALAAALRGLAEEPEVARALGAAGRQRAEQEFSAEVMMDRYWKCLCEVSR